MEHSYRMYTGCHINSKHLAKARCFEFSERIPIGIDSISYDVVCSKRRCIGFVETILTDMEVLRTAIGLYRSNRLWGM